jgi:hypothetical protein
MRVQQAKSLELRAEMSLARFWRDQGKVQARELFAPVRVVYGGLQHARSERDESADAGWLSKPVGMGQNY